jgi:hypothetical protein
MVNEDKNQTTGASFGSYVVSVCDDFSYVDPIDGSVSTKQVGISYILRLLSAL